MSHQQNITMLVALIWFVGYLVVGVRYWDATEFGDFLASIFRAFVWPVWIVFHLAKIERAARRAYRRAY